MVQCYGRWIPAWKLISTFVRLYKLETTLLTCHEVRHLAELFHSHLATFNSGLRRMMDILKRLKETLTRDVLLLPCQINLAVVNFFRFLLIAIFASEKENATDMQALYPQINCHIILLLVYPFSHRLPYLFGCPHEMDIMPTRIPHLERPHWVPSSRRIIHGRSTLSSGTLTLWSGRFRLPYESLFVSCSVVSHPDHSIKLKPKLPSHQLSRIPRQTFQATAE